MLAIEHRELHPTDVQRRTRWGVTSRHRFWVFIAATGVLAPGLGCSGWRHGATLAQYEGLLLSAAPSSAGAERLRIEMAYDPTLRAFVAQHGRPDYIYVADRFSVQLTYLDADRVVLFQRAAISAKSHFTVTPGIPAGLLNRLTPADQARVRARRVGAQSSIP
jgi:hypothetical protein